MSDPTRPPTGRSTTDVACHKFDRCHFCNTGTDVEPSTFDTPMGSFRLPACGDCAHSPPRLSCVEVARLSLSHPADGGETDW